MTTGRINQVTLFCTPKPDNQAAKPHTSAHPENGHAKRPTRANTHTQLAPRSTDDDTKTKRSLPLEANKHRLPQPHESEIENNPHPLTNGRTSHLGPKIRDEFIKQRFVAQYKQRLFDSSVTFHYPCHHTKRQRPPSNCCNSNATRLPDTHRLIASYTTGIQAQLQERTPTGRLANEFDLMLTQRVHIQTLPPASAAGDTSGPITAEAQVDTLRAHTTNTHKQQTPSKIGTTTHTSRLVLSVQVSVLTFRRVLFQIFFLKLKSHHTAVPY